MTPAESPAAPPKPTASPFWKGVMRLTALVTLLLFLTPTFYVVKYYAVDKPREERLSHPAAQSSYGVLSEIALTADDLPALQQIARMDGHWGKRQEAILAIEKVLLQPGIGWKRPLECAAAKAALAEAATKDPSLGVKQAAARALGRVAAGGAVIRR